MFQARLILKYIIAKLIIG